MRKIYLFTLGLLAMHFAASAQNGCGGGRYQVEIFGGHNLTSNVTYGANINLQNQNQSLELDIYEPQGDSRTDRALIVMEHGGSFVGGSKDQADITSLAIPLAKRGYVVASCEYRLGMGGFPFPGPDSTDASESVWRAVADMKAAVRFFYKSAQNGNPYGIDTNQIYIGGVSAGAVSAVHYAYLADLSEMPSYIDTTKAGLGGGIEGSSGNPGYSSKVQGVLNICGMIADTAWMDANEPPIVSLHGDQDATVPYGTDMIRVGGFFPIFVIDGSASIHVKADQLGIDNCFFTHWGADHTPHVGNAAYTDTTLNIASNFLHHLICSEPASCSPLVSADPAQDFQLLLYPNPANNAFKVEFDGAAPMNWSFQLIDMTGRVVHSEEMAGQSLLQIERNGLASGIYMARIQADGFERSLRLILE
jgi:poly(3-hydroxybutyrate) depolymerase